MNALVSGAWGETDVWLPINVESRGGMEGKLLGALARRGVPNDCRLFPKLLKIINSVQLIDEKEVYFVDSSTEDVVAFFVPLERKNRSFVLP